MSSGCSIGIVKILIIVIALLSCIISIYVLLHGLLIDGPEFYNGKGCRMTYSQYIFLPIRIASVGNNDDDVSSSSSSTTSSASSFHGYTQADEGTYRLLKFTDARDPRHEHLYPIVGNMKEDYASQQQQTWLRKMSTWRRNRHHPHKSNGGRMLELTDNWCLLPNNIRHASKGINNNDNDNSTSSSSSSTTTATKSKYTEAPYPHTGHIVLYIPGHWGSYLQSRSLGAHGTRYTGQHPQLMTNQEIYTSLQTGIGMNNGLSLRKKKQRLVDNNESSSSQEEEDNEEYHHHHQQQQQLQNEFVMDIYSLDYNEQGGALHSSILFKQAKYLASAIQTLALGCHLDTNNNDNDDGQREGQSRSITIVAHSIGAIIVRLALRLYPQLVSSSSSSSSTNNSSGYIHNIITLASPLGLDFPYAVDADIYDVIKFINDNDYDNHGDDDSDVSLVSISGGLRDEMIPPTSCQIPFSTSMSNVNKTNVDNTKNRGSGFVSTTFLASDIMDGVAGADAGSSPSTINSEPYGMDHRAIVWCYDLLTAVREIIFTLVNATDNGLSSSERLAAVTKVMDQRRRRRQTRDGVDNDESRWNESDYNYQKQVEKQHARLLLEKGYLQTVSIQLSAPYYLNTLLKLCITAALLDTYAIYPRLKFVRQSSSTDEAKRLFRINGFVHVSISLLSIPTILVMITYVRELSIPYHHQFCRGHECHLLLLSIFILTQIATLVYIIIVYGVCPLVSIIFMSPGVEFVGNSVDDSLSTRRTTFGISFVHLIATEIRTLTIFTLPLSVILCFMINTFILGFDDLAWNITAIASYCFISVVQHNLISLVILPTRSSVYLEQRRSEIFVLLLSLIKLTFGKSVFALSLMTHWGQRGLDSYHDYLTMTGKGNEMITRVLTVMLSSFIIMAVFRTHDAMTQTTYRRQQPDQPARMIDGKEVTGKKSTNISNIAIVLVRSALICWFTWTASVNIAADDVIIPIGLLTIILCLRCCSCSVHAIDICSSNGRSVRSESSTRTHDKVQ